MSIGLHSVSDDTPNATPPSPAYSTASTAISPLSPPYPRRRQSTSESSPPTIVGAPHSNNFAPNANSVPSSPTLPFPPSSPPDNFISLPSTPIDPMFFIPSRPSPAILAVERELGLPNENEATPRISAIPMRSTQPVSMESIDDNDTPTVRVTNGRFSLDDDEPSELPYAPSGSAGPSRISSAGSLHSHDRIPSPSLSPRAQRVLAPLERRPTPQLSEALAGRQRGKNGSVDLGRMSMMRDEREQWYPSTEEPPSNPNRISRASSRYRSDSSSSSIQRTTSVESVSSRSTSGPLKFSSRPPLPSPEERSRRSSAYAAPHDVSPQRPRPTRSASMATAPTASTSALATHNAGRRSEGSTSHIVEEEPVYISDSTTQGTISRRRKAPSFPSSNGNANGSVSDHVVEEEEHDVDMEQQSPPSLTAATASTREVSPAAGEFGRRTSPPQRHRALSQPSKRPLLASYLSDQAPPSLPSFKPRTVSPNLTRKMSMPMVKTLSVNTDVSLSRTASNSSITSFTRAPFAETPMSATSGFFPFRTSPPTHSSSYLSLSPPPFDLSQPTVSLVRRPFHLMRQIAASIETGGYITPRLYIPKSLWSQAGVKLVAIETKVRTLDILLTGVEGLEKYDDFLVSPTSPLDAAGAKDFASRFVKELDSFEGMMDGIQSTLSKKLGYSPSALGNKKVNAVSRRLHPRLPLRADCLDCRLRSARGARNFLVP